MKTESREKGLRWALVVIGLIFVVVAYPMSQVWPGGWVWGTSATRHNIDMMLMVYFVMGVFLLLAATNPKRHLSFIGFVIWANLAHGFVMLLMALGDVSMHWQHLLGDVPALIIVGVLLAWLCPQAFFFQFTPRAETGDIHPEPTAYNQGPT